MNDEAKEKKIWTLGHSVHAAPDFISILVSFNIKTLADIRQYPGSKRFPQFNQDELQRLLQSRDIGYMHIKELGGRRKPVVNSPHTAWRNAAFRGYADHMETDEFRQGIERLQNAALEKRVVYICSEALWWQCHRALVSDYLKIRGWQVMHIMNVSKVEKHPYTSAARIVDGELRYDTPELF